MTRRKELKIVNYLMVAVLAIGIALTVYGGQVLKLGDTGRAVIDARKGLMRSSFASFRDLRQKVGAGNIRGIAADTIVIVANASLTPILWEKAYQDEYTSKDSIIYKEGNWNDFVRAAENLIIEAEALAKLSREETSADVIDGQIQKMGRVCGDCHINFLENVPGYLRFDD